MNLRSWYLERPLRPIGAACRDFLSKALWKPAAPMPVDSADLRDARDGDQRANVLVALLPDGIFVIQAGIIVFANAAAAEIHGAKSADQLIGMKGIELVHPEVRAEILQRRRVTEAGGWNEPMVRTGVRLDGATFAGESRGSRVSWNGEPAILLVVRDVTEREQAREVLRESEIRIRGILEHVADSVITIDESGIIQSFNPAAESLFGYPADAVIGRNVSLLMPEPDHGRHDGYLKNYVHGGAGKIIGVGSREVTARHRDGTKIPVELTVAEMRIGGHRTFIGAIRDITERKQAERALQDSEARYRDLIEGSLLAVQIKEQDGKRVYVNQAFLDLFGYGTKEEVYRQDFGAFVAPHHLDDIENMRWARETGDPAASVNEFDARRKDGSVFPVQVFVRPIVWQGEFAQHRTYIDLSERKQAERALQDSEARYRDLIEGSELGIQITTRDGQRVFANRAFAKLFGYETPDELMAKPPRGLMAHHDRAKKSYREAFFEDDSAVSSYEFDGTRKDGSMIPLQAFMRRVTWDGEAAVQRTYIDLTERKKAEEQLRQAQKMEVVGQLTGGVAHDFNNLLTVILGNLDLLQGNLEDPDLSRMVQSAMDASSRGAELTQRLLAFSRKQALKPRPTDVDGLVAGMADLMRRSLGEPIEIEIAGGDDVWQCEIDPAQLENAILNLAINARDAMPRGGKLTIGMANVTVGERDAAAEDDFSAGEYVMISVADNGVGMARKVAERAFEPFFTTKDVGEGSGLGLSMVYGFIKQSGGHVTIDSEPDKGTTVKLYLRRSYDRRQAVEPAPDAVEPLSRGEKILVVEDDAEVRALIVNLLAGLGYAIVEAADGGQAIEVLKATPAIDLLFTDVVLPGGMSGADVAVEATRRIADIKVLYASGYTDNVLAREGQIDPGVQFINKPFRRGELAQKVRAALDGAAA